MLQLLRSGYKRMRSVLSKIGNLFSGPIDAKTLETLEALLYEADLGSGCVHMFLDFVRKHKKATQAEWIEGLQAYAETILTKPKTENKTNTPHITLIVGVNGSGKTTSAAKLANHLMQEGHSVLLAAADTFRAAAVNQLSLWADKLGIPCVKGSPGGDPAAVAFDALQAAKARGISHVIIDTAGRLHNKTDLMHELLKMRTVSAKAIPGAPHDILLVLDSTTGQNALDQAKAFHSFTPLTGIILTKLDGSAKGGIALAITHELGVPISWVGIGEKTEDFLPFNAKEYAHALFT